MLPLTTSATRLSGVAAPTPYLALAEAIAAGPAALALLGQQLHLDCSASPYQRTLGVCHQVSQLLLLRQGRAGVWLHGVHPVLRRCLHQLHVAHLFSWVA